MAPAKKKSQKRKADNRSVEDRLIDAALALAADGPWHGVSLPQIAEHAGVPLGKALLALPGRMHIQRALIRRVDAQVFDGLEGDPLDGSTRDKLFDILMRRFDALQGHQAALKSMSRDTARDPLGALCLGARLVKSMSLSLQAAGVRADGCAGALKAKALAAIHLNAFRVWLNDEDPGLAGTMAALDKNLARAEKLATRKSSSYETSTEAA